MAKTPAPRYVQPLGPAAEDFAYAAYANLERWLDGDRDLDYLKEARLLLETAEMKRDLGQ